MPNMKKNSRNKAPLWLTVSIVLGLFPGFAPGQQLPGTITGAVVDKTGSVIVGADVMLSQENHTTSRETVSNSGGEFSFSNVAPGSFHLSVSAEGFAPQESSGTLKPGETATLPQIILEIAKLTTDIQVAETRTELAEEQVRLEEQQRLLGLVPNYEVSYQPFVPLSVKEKFELAWKTNIDPASFGIVGLVAGVEQWKNYYSGYGQGAQGYAKRYGGAYGAFFGATMISEAVFPSLFKQDPRYFVKGKGSIGYRAAYAIANSVICKGDNGHWQPKISEVLGGLASSGISDLYLPAKDRNGAVDTFEDVGFAVGGRALANLFQEFFSRKLTPKGHH